MAARNTLKVEGYKEFMKALAKAPADVRREVRTALRVIGEDVRVDAQRNFSNYGSPGSRASHARSAAGYRVSVRQRGIEVDSRMRKTTGRHPEYGAAQMRHGMDPAARQNQGQALVRMDRAVRNVVADFERRAK